MSITKARPSEPYPIEPVVTRDLGDGPILKIAGLILGGAGALVEKILSNTSPWTPGAISDGSSVSKAVTVQGAAVGDVVTVGVYPALPAGCIASGQVTSGNTVTATIANLSGSSVTLPAGNIRVVVMGF